MRILVFLQGTILMHSRAVGRSREERAAQSRSGSDQSVRDSATHVPVGNAVAKLNRLRDQGATILYLTLNRDPAKVAQDVAILRRFGFPDGSVLARGPGESHGDVAGRELLDLLIEDDCKSIGADEITHPQLSPERRVRIKSIIVPEFGGIDRLPDSLTELLALD